MDKVKIRNILASARFHGGIILRGFARTLMGALIAGLLAVAIYGFVSIANEDGYIAVFDFIASVATLLLAVCNMYALGVKGRGKK